MEGNIYDKTNNGECSKCGGCCPGMIPLTKDEVRKIKRYVEKNNIKMRDRHLVYGYDTRCIFLNPDTKRCMIYSVRPYVCQDFICNRKEWKNKRKEYSDRAYYNKYSDGQPRNIATFDDLIYDNPEFLITYLVQQIKASGIDPNLESELLIDTLISLGRKDIAECIKFK